MNWMIPETTSNQIYNHNFVFANQAGNFAAGWHKHQHPGSTIVWDKKSHGIRFSNWTHSFSSIEQKQKYRIPVFERQVWEVGVCLKGYYRSHIRIIVHFYSSTSGDTTHETLNFEIKPNCPFYYGVVTVPDDFDYAYLELGVHGCGTVLLSEVIFRRVFPVDKYSTDAQGRLNIASVQELGRIIEPVRVKGPVEVIAHVRKRSVNLLEEEIAEATPKNSIARDVSKFSVYSFIVINKGSDNVFINLQYSPNGINWTDESVPVLVGPGQVKTAVEMFYVKYIRIQYYSENDNSNPIAIYFQAQY